MGGDTEKLKRLSETVSNLKADEIKCLDLAFVMDCTGSMQSYINEAKNNIRKIMEDIVASENCDVKLALIEYRDHPPQDSTFVTRTHDFTFSARTMKGWLSEAVATGGGDTPEAVADGLLELLALNWREEATKIGICISDAPPHGLGYAGDGFPDGCPYGYDPVEISHQLAEKGIILYIAGCEPALTPYKDFFMALAFITGGQYVPMARSQVLSKIITGSAQEELSLSRLIQEADTEVQQRTERGETVNEDDIAGILHARWASRGERVTQLQMNDAEVSSAVQSTEAKRYSKMKSLAEIRKSFKTNQSGVPAGSSGFSFGASGTIASSLESATFGSAITNISYAQSSRLVQRSVAKGKSSQK